MYVKQESAGTEKRVAEQKLIRSDQIRSSEGGPGELCSEQKDGEEKGWPERAVHLGGCRERRRRTIRFLILLARSLTHSEFRCRQEGVPWSGDAFLLRVGLLLFFLTGMRNLLSLLLGSGRKTEKGQILHASSHLISLVIWSNRQTFVRGISSRLASP